MLEMAGEFPALSSVFVGERDIFLTHSLQMAADSIPPQCLGPDGQRLESLSANTVVGVVGIGHTAGIAAHWGQVSQEQVRAVVQVEPPSTASRVFTFTVRTAMWAGCLYGAYRYNCNTPLVRNYILFTFSGSCGDQWGEFSSLNKPVLGEE